ncbi:MAG: hypothetical protein ACLRSW_15625 [Christensenellaceae bacterium]
MIMEITDGRSTALFSPCESLVLCFTAFTWAWLIVKCSLGVFKSRHKLKLPTGCWLPSSH